MTLDEKSAKLLAFVQEVTDAKHGQMTLRRLVTDTYPDPTKTSWNDMVTWSVTLTFGVGYFSGAMVHYTGRWAAPHPGQGDPEGYRYNEAGRDMSVEDAVKQFLSNDLPDWTKP